MKTGKIFTAVKALAVIGILLAIYLLWEQYTKAPSICSISSTINCDAIISGTVSKTLGIPTPLFGLIGYLVILFAAIRKMRRTILWVAVFGLSFCLWIAYQELFLLRVICPVCILCQIDMITVFILAIILNRHRKNTK